MDCNELVEIVTAYLDESLDPEETGPLRPTLLRMDGCQNYSSRSGQPLARSGRCDEQLDPIFRAGCLIRSGLALIR